MLGCACQGIWVNRTKHIKKLVMIPWRIMRIGFLFNHETPHQVLHAAPTACELSRHYPGLEVILITSGPAVYNMVERVLSLYPDHSCQVVKARLPRAIHWLSQVVQPFILLQKRARQVFNRHLFKSLDVLVTPEKTSLHLKRDPGLQHLVMIHTRHGVGDRAVGFDSRSGQFDLVLAAGPKVKQRLVSKGSIEADRCQVVGYPKFDVAPFLAEQKSPFSNKKPIVLYNPHYSRQESSWPKMGRQVLDIFCNNTKFNLIFAPHPILYARTFRHKARPLNRYQNKPNILLDTGSPACSDMSYVLAADIYLGDVSSQVYEFLWRPRPCIFLDANRLIDHEPKENLRHWQAGQVLTDIDQLPAALDRVLVEPKAYIQQQEILVQEAFDHDPNQSASVRAAEAIANFLGYRTKEC